MVRLIWSTWLKWKWSVYLCRFLCLGGKKVNGKEKRWYKDVGLGFKTPADAISGTYIGELLARSFL